MERTLTTQEINNKNRNLIIEQASRACYILFDGPVKDYHTVMLRNIGLLTHITLQMDFRKLDQILLADFNYNLRIKCKPDHLMIRRNTALLQIASVFFDGDDYLIKDLRGAMYLNVTNAVSSVALTGNSRRVIVRQHVLDSLPVTAQGHPILPHVDLTHVNQLIY